MDEANIEYDHDVYDHEHEQQQQQQHAQYEYEREQRQAAAAADEKNQRHQKIMSVLGEKGGFSFRTRNKMDVLIKDFLFKLENDIHDMFCDHNSAAPDMYLGLDSERDTNEEVETTIRFFPDVLTRRKRIAGFNYGNVHEGIVGFNYGNAHEGYYPIQYLAFSRNENDGTLMWNLKSASFIPFVVQLSVELNLFEDYYRGGLLYLNSNNEDIFGLLMLSDRSELHNREYHETADDKCVQVLLRLRIMGFLKERDIQKYGIMLKLFYINYYHFAEKRFIFLVEWDPYALKQTCEEGKLGLHYAAKNCNSIRGFQLLFEYGICYYPKKIGISLLFQEDNDGDTPFQLACHTHGRNEVMKVVEDILLLYDSSDSTPLNIAEALITAAIDDYVHLDCVFFLIRRQPDILQEMDKNNVDNLSKTKKTYPEKRKRKEKKKKDDDDDE
jgi:hypothetical protein